MLETRNYTKTEMVRIFGTTSTQGLKRKLERYGVDFEMRGRGRSLVFDIKEVPDKFKLFCISEFGCDGRTDFHKLREFLYCYINDDEFRAMPDEVKEYRLDDEEKHISRQTIAKYTSKLADLDLINRNTGEYIYYFAYKDNQRITEHGEYVEAWKQYWEDKGNGADTMEAIWNMRHIYGGVARKQTIPAFNGIYIDKITELNNIICESIENELK